MKKFNTVLLFCAFLFTASNALANTYFADPVMERSQKMIDKQEDFIKKIDNKSEQTYIKMENAKDEAKEKQELQKQNIDNLKKDFNSLKEPYKK